MVGAPVIWCCVCKQELDDHARIRDPPPEGHARRQHASGRSTAAAGRELVEGDKKEVSDSAAGVNSVSVQGPVSTLDLCLTKFDQVDIRAAAHCEVGNSKRCEDLVPALTDRVVPQHTSDDMMLICVHAGGRVCRGRVWQPCWHSRVGRSMKHVWLPKHSSPSLLPVLVC
jgi:hypothetical protein